MAIESKEVIMGVRKATMSSITIIYRSVCAHPYISAMLFFFLLLSRTFPSLFSFLVSSSPVIVCTAILLGTLLSYGTPNIPHIEEEDKKTQKISSLRTGSVVDDIVVKKDESITVETHLETGKEEVVGTSNSSSDEIVRDVPSAKMYDEGGGNNYTILTTSASLHKETKEMDNDVEVMKEREVLDREFSVNNQNELEGFRIQTAKIASDSPFDSSLGSPWQPVNTFDASSGSDSDGAESSSPDASMADIIPMLNELDPLLKSERPHATLSSNDNSDSSSSGSSQDRELEEVDNKGDEIKESHAKDESNEVAVAWTENDQNNVMDLGYSEIERNRRLENLIARRRLRKLQRYETEKNLIDLDSLYPTSIPSISAPRRNPFDLPYDYDGNLNLPPIPGSAPSVMQPRRNPFDLSYDEIEKIGNMSREYLNHHDFVSSVQREMLSQRHESSTIEPSLLGDFNQGNEDSKLTEPDIHQGSIMLLSPVSHDVEHVEQDKQSSGATGSIDNDHAVDFNTSASIGETHQGVNSFGVKEEIGEVGNNLSVSDTQKLEDGEDGCEDSSSSSSLEAYEKILRVNSYEESANVEETDEKLEGGEDGCEDSSPSSSSKADEILRVNSYEDSANVEETRHVSIQSKQLGNASAADPIYDSNLSVIDKTITNILSHDEAFIYDATENVISNSLPSVQVDFAEGALPQRPFEADIPLEDKDLVGVRSEGEDFSSGMVEISQSSQDVPPVAALLELETGKIMHSTRSSYLDSESSEDHMVDVDKNVQSEGNEAIYELPSLDESAIHLLPEARIEKSHVNSLDSSSIPKENLEEHQKSVVHPPASSDLTALQVVEESNVHMLDVEQETSICQKAAEEIGHDDLAIGAVPEEKNGDALVETSTIQTYDGEFPGSESTESIEFSNISHVKLDHEMGTINDSIDTQRTVTNEILIQNEGEFLKKLSNSGEELDAEVHTDVSRLTDIDEGLLPELDAVGDFQAERELISSQEVSNQELGQISSIIEDSCAESQDSKVSSVNYDATPLGDDAELTVYNSELHALGACSLEERKESAVPLSDLTTENLVPTEPESGPRELGIANNNQETTEADTDLLVLEAKSIEDISAALKQISKGLDKPSTSEVETSVALPEITHVDAEEISSDLHVVEAKSLEDINLVLKQPSEATLDSHQGERKHENVCTEIEASGKDLEAEALEVKSAHVEVKSAEVIKLDSVEQSAEKSDGNENVANVSSASTSRKVRKKKSGSSSSDSSSSSSSSDSE